MSVIAVLVRVHAALSATPGAGSDIIFLPLDVPFKRFACRDTSDLVPSLVCPYCVGVPRYLPVSSIRCQPLSPTEHWSCSDHDRIVVFPVSPRVPRTWSAVIDDLSFFRIYMYICIVLLVLVVYLPAEASGLPWLPL